MGQALKALALPAASLVAGLAFALTGRRTQLGHQLPLPGFEPPPAKEPRCAAVVQVGRIKPSENRPRPRGFRACLTPTQFARLFPEVTKLPRGVWPRARCGVFGCAYPRGLPGTPHGEQVIKFTNDAIEARTAARLAHNPVSGALPVYEVFRLNRKGAPVWAIRSRLLPPPGRGMARALGACSRPFVNYRVHGGPNAYIGFIGCVDAMATRMRLNPEASDVEGFVMKFLDTVQDLEAQGIVWTDLHAGNVTIDEAGDPVIVDIGPYAIEGDDTEEAEIPRLHGLRRPGARAARRASLRVRLRSA